MNAARPELTSSSGATPRAAGTVIAGRYAVLQLLGQGATSRVYRVRDISTEREMALKLASVGTPYAVASAAQFEREYYTLQQLVHPSIIEVYDFGIEDGSPFYTMELLTGADLSVAAPLAWREAVSLLLPVVSSLAVLHSRRLIHRDVSIANVRRTAQGGAKLIDFGAMTEMGVARQIVGTFAYMPPEAVNHQSLDPRVDLYAVGALLYRLLTGEDAYPAATFTELRQLWQFPVPSVYDIDQSVPEALSALVARLLDLEASARPHSAAEVMERLSAIAGLPLDESLAVRQAYLTTPKLVARESEVQRAREFSVAARDSHGGVVLIRGASGVGRSRVLDACVLEAKLAGNIVLRADASSASDFALARALVEQLAEAVPAALQTAPHEFAHLADPASASAQRSQLQAALQAWLITQADRYGLALAIDDLQDADEPSAALLALLSAQATEHRLLLFVTLVPDAKVTNSKAVALIEHAATTLDLKPLDAQQSEQLVTSLFGEIPHIRLLAARLHALSEGNPRSLMDLAQHLVTQGVVRYESGAWTTPARFDANDLPKRVQQALQVSIDALSPHARLLADILALCQDVSFSHDEFMVLADWQQRADLHVALDELIATRMLRGADGRYAFRHPSTLDLLRSALPAERAGGLHRRLATVLARRGDEPLRTAMHWLAAGEVSLALDAAVVLSIRWINRAQAAMQDQRYLQMTMSDEFTETLQAALGLFDTQPRPRYERHAVQLALLYAALHGRVDVMKRYLPSTLEQLALDSGLRDFELLSASLEPGLRLRQALSQVRARYEAAGGQQRVFALEAAIRYLIRLVHSVAALAGAKLDFELLDMLPALGPLEPLSPALTIARQNLKAVRRMSSGRHLAAIALYHRMIARLDQPDHAGHEPTLHKYVRLALVYAAGHSEAALGLESALDCAVQLESDPLYALNALRLRKSYHLARGAVSEAEVCRRKLELLQLQNAPPQFFEGNDVFRSLPAYASADDLLNVKRSLDTIEELAKQSVGWVPVRHYAAGQYARIRGDHTTALACFADALALTQPGNHQVWPHAAEQYLYALVALGRAREAEALGRQWAEAWEREGLIASVGVAYAVVQAELGERSAALARLDAIIAQREAQSVHGVELGRAYEVAARIAQEDQQWARYQAYRARCREEYAYGGTPLFMARYQRLVP